MPGKKFKNIFYLLLVICLITIVSSFFAFDFIELDPAVNWTMKYFALPILILMIPLSYIIYQKFIRQNEKKRYLSGIFVFFRVFILTIGLTIVLIGTTLSLIILSNGYLGESQSITINTNVIDYEITGEGIRKGPTKHYIKINVPQVDRLVELKVDRAYKIGEPFIKTMNIGKWGLLYSND